MSILALDLGTKTGWAIFANGSTDSGTWSFQPKRYDNYGRRFLRFRQQVKELHQRTEFSEVYFEDVRNHKGTYAAQIYGGFVAELTEWCERMNISCEGVSVSDIKKQATGKGNSGKDAMVAAAIGRGWFPVDDNEADALWLLDYAMSQQDIDLDAITPATAGKGCGE